MKASRLDALWRDGVSFDLETHLIQPGLVAPPVVCGSLAIVTDKGMQGELLDRAGASATFRQILRDPRYTLCGANIAYDVICQLVNELCDPAEVFAMYDPTRGAIRGDVDGRVFDVQRAEELHAIGRGHLGLDPMTGRPITNPDTGRRGRYSLREVVRQTLGRDDAKVNDRYRMSYALLESTPLAEWPVEARTYPVDDAINTLEAALAQSGAIPSCAPHRWPTGGPGSEMRCVRCGAYPGGAPECRARERRLNAHEISRQTYVSLCMSLGAAWGFHVNQASVDALEARYNAEHTPESMQPFRDAGILRDDGTENQSVLKQLVARAYGANSRCTDPSCRGTGKVPSPATVGKTKINCKQCDGTGLHLPTQVPRTEKAGVGKGEDVLQESGDELLMSYVDIVKHGKKVPNVYIPFMRGIGKDGIPHTGVPLVLRPNPMLETGRTSYDGVIQLLPRSGGIRECIEARPGYVFSSEDYNAGEMVTHAQSCIWIVGASRLAEALNKGLDAHLAGAATVLGISYDDAVKRKKAGDKQIADVRQAFKPANFGFPGRMGAAKLVVQQRKGGPDTAHPSGPTWILDEKGQRVRGYRGLRFCLLMGAADACGTVKVTEWKGRDYPPLCKKCIECAEQLRKSWLTQWPENVAYFDHVKRVDESGEPVVQHVSKRLRGFKHGQVDDDGQPINSGNAIANGYFQALLADAAKNALMAATRECYDRTTIVRSSTYMHAGAERSCPSEFEGGPSPLLGSRIIVFQHDELVCEHPEPVASEAAIRISEIMVEALRLMCPDLAPACKAEPTLMRKLYKGASPRWRDGDDKRANKADRLVCWEPK